MAVSAQPGINDRFALSLRANGEAITGCTRDMCLRLAERGRG